MQNAANARQHDAPARDTLLIEGKKMNLNCLSGRGNEKNAHTLRCWFCSVVGLRFAYRESNGYVRLLRSVFLHPRNAPHKTKQVAAFSR